MDSPPPAVAEAVMGSDPSHSMSEQYELLAEVAPKIGMAVLFVPSGIKMTWSTVFPTSHAIAVKLKP